MTTTHSILVFNPGENPVCYNACGVTEFSVAEARRIADRSAEIYPFTTYVVWPVDQAVAMVAAAEAVRPTCKTCGAEGVQPGSPYGEGMRRCSSVRSHPMWEVQV